MSELSSDHHVDHHVRIIIGSSCRSPCRNYRRLYSIRWRLNSVLIFQIDLKLVEFEKKLFKLMSFKREYCYLFFISKNEAIWLAEEPFRAGRFFASGPLWNATAGSGFRGKKWGVKQFLDEKICPKRRLHTMHDVHQNW
jgi:hypothetical protein